MPMCSDVKNCLFGDGTLCCDILLGGLFAFVCLFQCCFLTPLCYFAMIALFVHVLCCIKETNVSLEEKNNSSFNVGFLIFLQVMFISQATAFQLFVVYCEANLVCPCYVVALYLIELGISISMDGNLCFFGINMVTKTLVMCN